MEFREGQKVQTKNGLTGVVKGIYDGEADIQIREEELVEEYIENLMPYTFHNETLSRVKKLERHPIFEIAKQTPVFVVNDKAYNINENERDSFKQKREARNVAEFSSIPDLDSLALQRNEKAIDNIRNWYASKILFYIGVTQNLENMSVPQFIYSQVLPNFRYSKEQRDERINKILRLLGSEQVSEQKEFQKRNVKNSILEQSARNFFKDIEKIKKTVLNEHSSRQDEFFNGFIKVNRNGKSVPNSLKWNKNFALVDGGFYLSGKNSLSFLEDKKSMKLILQNRNFCLRKVGNIEEAEKEYMESLATQIKLAGLESLTEEGILDILIKNQDQPPKNLKEYHEKDFGFFSLQGENGRTKHFVYLTVPNLGFKTKYLDNSIYDDNYFLFPKSRIGIEVFQNGSKFMYDEEVIQFDESFFFLDDYKESAICLDGAKMPTSGRDIGDVMAKRLKTIKAMIYDGRSKEWYCTLYEESNLEELRKSRIRIKEVNFDQK